MLFTSTHWAYALAADKIVTDHVKLFFLKILSSTVMKTVK